MTSRYEAVALAVALALLACDGGSAQAPRLEGRSEASAARELTVRWVGDARGDGPVLVLLHGWGAPGDDLVGLGRQLRTQTGGTLRVAVPEAPLERDHGGGRAWWQIDASGPRPSDRWDERPDGLAAARRDVQALLRSIDADPERTTIAGFSQGGMLAMDVGLRSDRVGAIVSLSGGPLDADAWLARAEGKRIFLSHGRRDPLLAFGAAERLRRQLAQRGADVTWVPFDGPHAIPPVVVRRLVAFLGE